jgi:hypothetical protein
MRLKKRSVENTTFQSRSSRRLERFRFSFSNVESDCNTRQLWYVSFGPTDYYLARMQPIVTLDAGQ